MKDSIKTRLEKSQPRRFTSAQVDVNTELNIKPCVGLLTLTIELKGDIPDDIATSDEFKRASEEASAETGGGAIESGFMQIGCDLKVVDSVTGRDLLDTDDIVGCNPHDYLSNGIVAGIVDAIRSGLAEDRGINFKYAIEEVRRKAADAAGIVALDRLNTSLKKRSLELADPQGEA